MQVTVKKMGQRYRVVETGTDMVAKRNGKAADGGGHPTNIKAMAQALAINISERAAAAGSPKKKKAK